MTKGRVHDSQWIHDALNRIFTGHCRWTVSFYDEYLAMPYPPGGNVKEETKEQMEKKEVSEQGGLEARG